MKQKQKIRESIRKKIREEFDLGLDKEAMELMKLSRDLPKIARKVRMIYSGLELGRASRDMIADRMQNDVIIAIPKKLSDLREDAEKILRDIETGAETAHVLGRLDNLEKDLLDMERELSDKAAENI